MTTPEPPRAPRKDPFLAAVPYLAATWILLLTALVCVLLMIWRPVGSWWQWLLTAVVLVLAAATTSNVADERVRPKGGER